MGAAGRYIMSSSTFGHPFEAIESKHSSVDIHMCSVLLWFVHVFFSSLRLFDSHMFPQTWHQGLPASPGAAFGKVVFCADEALTKTKSCKMMESCKSVESMP